MWMISDPMYLSDWDMCVCLCVHCLPVSRRSPPALNELSLESKFKQLQLHFACIIWGSARKCDPHLSVQIIHSQLIDVIIGSGTAHSFEPPVVIVAIIFNGFSVRWETFGGNPLLYQVLVLLIFLPFFPPSICEYLCAQLTGFYWSRTTKCSSIKSQFHALQACLTFVLS